jgi:hypothetical protein
LPQQQNKQQTMKKKITVDIEVLLPTQVTKEVELPLYLYDEKENSHIMYCENDSKYIPYQRHEIKFYSDETVRYWALIESDKQFEKSIASIGENLQPSLKEEFIEAFKTYINQCVDRLNTIASIEE